MNWTIKPVCVGIFHGQERSNIVYGRGHGEKLRTPSVVFAIENGEEAIILDTGIADPERAMEIHGVGLDRSPEQEPAAALRAVGVEPEAVRTVVLSHLHWDHAANNDIFTNARFLVQREEIKYASAPLPCHADFYESPSTGVTARWLSTADRFDVIEGDTKLADGIDVLFLPGHCPGLQGLMVQTSAGVFGVTSDCVSRYECWRDRPRGEWLPSGQFVDLEVYYRSLARVEEAADYVLPSHDIDVFEQASYP